MPKQVKPWYRSASDTWYGRIDGRPCSLHVRGRINEAAAWEAWHRLRAGETGTPPGNLTVAELVDAFLADCSGRAKPRTVKVYTFFLTPFAAGTRGRRRAASLTADEVTAYSRKPGWSPSTRNSFVGAVCAAFRFGERRRSIPRNTLAGMPRPPKGSRGAKAVMTAEEVGRLIDHANPQFAMLLRVLWMTGCRPSEASQLVCVSVLWDDGVAVLESHKTADVTGGPRALFLPPEAVALLRPLAAKHPTGPLLRKPNGKPWDVNSVYQTMRQLKRRAGVPHATAYGFRHTFATDALANGVPEAHVAELLGHKGTAMLHKHYAHLGTKAAVLRAALGRVRGEGGN